MNLKSIVCFFKNHQWEIIWLGCVDTPVFCKTYCNTDLLFCKLAVPKEHSFSYIMICKFCYTILDTCPSIDELQQCGAFSKISNPYRE